LVSWGLILVVAAVLMPVIDVVLALFSVAISPLISRVSRLNPGFFLRSPAPILISSLVLFPVLFFEPVSHLGRVLSQVLYIGLLFVFLSF
jgi:hypothetical protein